jgi:phenylacetate-CoA ligase
VDSWLRFRSGKTPGDIDRVLRFVVRSASRRIPLYRQLLEHSGATGRLLQGVSDLPGYPIVTRSGTLHNVPVGELTHARANPSRLVRVSTSGYSGTPISIYMNRAEAFYRRWQVLQSWQRLVRLPLPVRVADLAGAVADPSRATARRRGLVRIRRISHALPMEAQVRTAAKFAPHVISGSPTVLDLLADGVRESGLRIRSVRLVASRGEILFPDVRARLEKAFRCRVADFYSCEEVGVVASECPADPAVYHVNTDACIVEIVDADGFPVRPEIEGRILLTNLYNCTMPLIRYAIGDRAAWAAPEGGVCECGSGRPRMRLVGGREDDYVFLPDGRRMSPRLLGTTIYRVGMDSTLDGTLRWLFRGFQVVQDGRDHVTVRVMAEVDVRSTLEVRIPTALQAVHPDLRATVVFVDDLPIEPSGKFRKIACKIADPRQRGS